jgi:addiction module HigA family antidote
MSRSRTTTNRNGVIPPARTRLFGPEELLVRLPTHGPPTHPGEMLREEYLPDFGWTPDELAARLRVAPELVADLLAERTNVTPELALRLGRLFRQTPAMWIKLQLACDFHAALASSEVELIEPVPPPQPVRKAS